MAPSPDASVDRLVGAAPSPTADFTTNASGAAGNPDAVDVGLSPTAFGASNVQTALETADDAATAQAADITALQAAVEQISPAALGQIKAAAAGLPAQGLAFWLDPNDDETITGDDSGVTEIRDKMGSGLAFGAFEAPPTRQTYGAAALLKCLAFDGTQSLVLPDTDALSFLSWGPATVFALVRYDADDNVRTFFGNAPYSGVAPNTFSFFENAGHVAAYVDGGGTIDVDIDLAVGDLGLVTFHIDPSQGDPADRALTRLNRAANGDPNSSSGGPNTPGDPFASPLALGTSQSGFPDNLIGIVGEVLIYDESERPFLTANDIARIEQYLWSKILDFELSHLAGDEDPSAFGFSAVVGSTYARRTDGTQWRKADVGDTDWVLLADD